MASSRTPSAWSSSRATGASPLLLRACSSPAPTWIAPSAPSRSTSSIRRSPRSSPTRATSPWTGPRLPPRSRAHSCAVRPSGSHRPCAPAFPTAPSSPSMRCRSSTASHASIWIPRCASPTRTRDVPSPRSSRGHCDRCRGSAPSISTPAVRCSTSPARRIPSRWTPGPPSTPTPCPGAMRRSGSWGAA